MEPSIKPVDGCDSECFIRHHVCAIREVRRLRELIDSILGPPDENLRYEDLLLMYNKQCEATDKFAEDVQDLKSRLFEGEEVVPAAWLRKANSQIEELNNALLKRRREKLNNKNGPFDTT